MSRWGVWLVYLLLVLCGLAWAAGGIWFGYGIGAFFAGLAVTFTFPLIHHLANGGDDEPHGSFHRYLVWGGWCVLVLTVAFALMPVLMRNHRWAEGQFDCHAMRWHLFAWCYGIALIGVTGQAAWHLLTDVKSEQKRLAVLLNLAFLLPLAGLLLDWTLSFYWLGLLLLGGMTAAWFADGRIVALSVEETPRDWILHKKP